MTETDSRDTEIVNALTLINEQNRNDSYGVFDTIG